MSLLTDEQKERMRKATALRVLKDMSPSEIDETFQSLKDKLDVAERRIKELENERGRLHQFRAESAMARKILLNKGDDAEDVAPIDLKNALLKRDLEQQAKGVDDAINYLISEAESLPLQHEMQNKGCSTYNWLTHAARLLKQLRQKAEDL